MIPDTPVDKTPDAAPGDKKAGAAADKVRQLHEKLDREAKDGGYNLNPDADLVTMLCEGLVANIERYGYGACPCRLATGRRADDLDIICPCDYRDPDLAEYDTCYCALYVGADVVSGKKKIGSIPERRPTEDERKAAKAREDAANAAGMKPGGLPGAARKVWRCKVCGYLCAMENPPGKCPICKADKDRFEEF